jgi:hypothetical protein
MEPNTKLLIEELMKQVREGIKEGSPHEFCINVCLSKIALSKLNTFFDPEAKTPNVPKPSMPTSQIFAADNSTGHLVEFSHRDCRFGRVYPNPMTRSWL